jgi:hypothetical protein
VSPSFRLGFGGWDFSDFLLPRRKADFRATCSTKGWIQISSWYLFIIGILNMLAVSLIFLTSSTVSRFLPRSQNTENPAGSCRASRSARDSK